MNYLTLIIHNIKNIKHAQIELPITNDILAIVGNNGCGKSTIMSCLAQLLSRHNLGLLRKEDYNNNSYVEFISGNKCDHWYCKDNFWQTDTHPHAIRYNGRYEGSLFYGMRFEDSKNVDELMASGKISNSEIVLSDEYITKKLGYILHQDENFYSGLSKLKNKFIANNLKLKNTPYFKVVNNFYISQYRMSSGECLLISLLHFIYNSLIRRSLPSNLPILLLIDEIELALHPIAITNLMDLLKELIKKYNNLTVIITSHAPEVIRNVEPKNLFKIEFISDNINNSIEVTNPCYPSYAIRDVYRHDGFDFLLLVEDKLAQLIVEKAIDILRLKNSRLINIMPVGGFNNVLELHYELYTKNVLGYGKKIISILDGDIKDRVDDKFKDLPKFFLPIPSIEKYIYKNIIEKNNTKFIKEINDVFFLVNSLKNIEAEYIQAENDRKKALKEKYKKDMAGKRFYNKIINEINRNKYSESDFINKIYDIIKDNTDLTKFNKNLRNFLTI